eukprot:1537815-Lingulodinium_polyedra.AAC.1
MRRARTRHVRAVWRAVRVCVRGAFRRVEAAECARGRVIAQHFSKRCATTRSDACFAVSARRNVPR